jgi:hypothetical protein
MAMKHGSRRRPGPRAALSALLVLAGLPGAAQVGLNKRHVSLTAGAQVELKAHHPEGQPRAWQWRFTHGPAPPWASLHPGEHGTANLVAGPVDRPQMLEVEVWFDGPGPLSSRSARALVDLLPDIPGLDPAIVSTILPSVHPGWCRGSFVLTPFPDATPAPGPPKGEGPGYRAACRVDDPRPERADWQGTWVVADDQGLARVTDGGVVTRLPWPPVPGPRRVVTALAARPRDAGPGNPWHLVLACHAPSAPDQASQVWALAHDGSYRPLLGVGPDRSAGLPPFLEIHALTMDRAGRIQVLGREEGGSTCIRPIDPDGTPTRPAQEDVDDVSLFNLFDHAWSPAIPKRTDRERCLLLDASGMVQDPASGDLYVALRTAILRITPDGRRTSILGAPSANARTALPVSGTAVPPDQPCLGQVGNLALRGDELYFFDAGEWFLTLRRQPQPVGLCAFNLATRVFRLLVPAAEAGPSDPKAAARDGVLAAAWPTAPEAHQAQLGPSAGSFLVFRPDGTGLLGTRDALFTLDLDLEPLPPPAGGGTGDRGPGAVEESNRSKEGRNG